MNFRSTVVIFILFVLCVGSYFLIWDFESGEGSLVDDQKKISEAYGLDKNEVQRIRLSFKDASYDSLTLAKHMDRSWELTEPFYADADESKVYELLNDLLNKRIKRTIGVTELMQYGLDSPNILIELWTESTSLATTFLIGKKTINYSVYAKEKSEPHAFLIESSALRDFTKSPADVRKRTVFEFNPDQVSSISLTAVGRAEIRCENSGADAWQMIKPVRTTGDAKEIRSILDALRFLKVVVFEADSGIDLAKYGLDAPRIKVAIEIADRVEQLLVGSRDTARNRVYIKTSTIDAVYAVNDEICAALDKEIYDLREKRIIDFERTTTNRLEIRRNTEKIVCSKLENGKWWIQEPVVLKANTTVVHDLLFGVDSLKAAEFVADQPENLELYGLARPSMRILFSSPGFAPVVLLVGDREGGNVYVKVQDSSSIALVRSDVIDSLGPGIARLRDKQILDFKSDEAYKLTLQHSGLTLTCQKQGANWRLVSPVKEDAKNSAVNNVISLISALTVEEFLAPLPNADVTGLDSPEIQLTVILENHARHTLQVGKTAESGQRYGCLRAELGTIFLLKADIVDKLKKTVGALRALPDDV